MTVGQLLRDADSAELTGWQAYHQYLREQEAKTDGRRIQWGDD